MIPETLVGWLDHISRQHSNVIEMGLDRVALVLGRMRFARSDLGRVITVGGTNGKGSTVAALEALLKAQGFSVCAYTSPHLLAYNERVRINGQDATDERLCAAFSEVEQARADVPLTYFEFGTLAALALFAEQRPDFCVLEVGLGGRLDAVNAVDPDLAIITTVDIDHVDWLGPDREAIGREKAGILRSSALFVCGDTNPPASVQEHAEHLQCKSFWRGNDFDVRLGVGGTWSWAGVDSSRDVIHVQDLPNLQIPVDNAATALQALAALGALPEPGAIARTLEQVEVPGRFQTVMQSPHVVLDVGHNPQAANYLKQRVRIQGGRWKAVFSALEDKDIACILGILADTIDEWYCAPLEVERAASREALEKACVSANLSKVRWSDSITDAFKGALHASQRHEHVLVFGSFYTVAAILEYLQANQPDAVPKKS